LVEVLEEKEGDKSIAISINLKERCKQSQVVNLWSISSTFDPLEMNLIEY